MTIDTIAELRGRGADGCWLADLVEAFLAGGKPLAGLLSAPRPLGTAPRYRERDDALRDAGRYFPTSSIAATVKELRRAIRRYETTRWRRVDRHRAMMPVEYSGKLDEALYRALASGGGTVPMSRTRLHKILSADQSLKRPGLQENAPKRTIRALRGNPRNAGDSDDARR